VAEGSDGSTTNPTGDAIDDKAARHAGRAAATVKPADALSDA
jgi:hypothetical protein